MRVRCTSRQGCGGGDLKARGVGLKEASDERGRTLRKRWKKGRRADWNLKNSRRCVRELPCRLTRALASAGLGGAGEEMTEKIKEERQEVQDYERRVGLRGLWGGLDEAGVVGRSG